MDTFTLSLGRCWIIRALGRNPLVRFSDRVEAVVLVLVFATALVVTPVAGAIGTAVYEARARLYAEQAQTRHTVAATAIEDSTVIVEQDDEAFRVHARWHANGVEHFGSLDLAHADQSRRPTGCLGGRQRRSGRGADADMAGRNRCDVRRSSSMAHRDDRRRRGCRCSCARG